MKGILPISIFKNMRPFLGTFFSLYKILFFTFLLSDGRKACPFMEACPFIFFSNCNVIFALNNYDYESTYSLKRRRFRQQFLKFTSLIKSSFLKNIKKSYLLILTPKRNPSCPQSRKERNNFKGLHKTFWDTTKKCENENLT